MATDKDIQDLLDEVTPMQTTNKVDALLNEFMGSPSTINRSVDDIRKRIGLPNYDKVERDIVNRTGALDTLRTEVNTPYDFSEHPIKSTLKPFVTGMKTIGVPLERAMAALGNSALSLQEGDVGGVPKAAWQGVTGERLGTFGDVYAKTGMPRLLSEPLGLASEMAVSGGGINLATKGKFFSDAGSKIVATKQALRNNKFKALDVANDAADAVKNVITKAGQDIGAFYRGPGGKQTVPANLVNRVVNYTQREFPELLNKWATEVGSNFQPTRANLFKLKKITEDAVSDQSFVSLLGSTAKQKKLTRLTETLSKLASHNNSEIKNLNSTYSKVIKEAGPVLKLIKSGKEAEISGIARIVRQPMVSTLQKHLTLLSDSVPELEKAIKTAKNVNRSVAMKRFFGSGVMRGLEAAAIYGGVRAVTRRNE